MKVALAALAFVAAPALAQDGGFFPVARDQGEQASLRVLQCHPGQSMACTLRCPAPSDGRMPTAAACTVVKCACDDEPVKADLANPSAPTALVTFNLRELLGLPQPK